MVLVEIRRLIESEYLCEKGRCNYNYGIINKKLELKKDGLKKLTEGLMLQNPSRKVSEEKDNSKSSK